MAKYRAKADLFVDGYAIKSGEEFESDNTPGRNWIPLDAGAKAKVKATFGDETPPAPVAPPNILEPGTPVEPEPKAAEEQPKANKLAATKPTSTESKKS